MEIERFHQTSGDGTSTYFRVLTGQLSPDEASKHALGGKNTVTQSHQKNTGGLISSVKDFLYRNFPSMFR